MIILWYFIEYHLGILPSVDSLIDYCLVLNIIHFNIATDLIFWISVMCSYL